MRMINRLLFSLGIILLSTAVFPKLLPPAFRPDLFAVLVIFLVLRFRRDKLLQTCWCIGFAKDILSGGPLGAMALAYLIIAVILLPMQRILNTRRGVSLALFGFGVAFACELALLAPALVHANGVLVQDALFTLFLASLATAAVTPIGVALLDRLKRPLGLDRRIVFGMR